MFLGLLGGGVLGGLSEGTNFDVGSSLPWWKAILLQERALQ